MNEKWNVSMKDEEDKIETLVSEGKQPAEIKKVDLITAEISGSGHPYFLWICKLESGEGKIKIITTLQKGKRWLLKQMLSACGIEAKEDDPDEKYKFSPDDVLHKIVMLNIKNEEETYTIKKGNRAGEQVTEKKSKVFRIEKYLTTSKKIEPELTEPEPEPETEEPF